MLLKDDIYAAFQQQQEWPGQAQLTSRDYLTGFKTTGNQVEVLTGIRRCGKSTLMRQLSARYGKTAFFNFEDPRVFGFEVKDFGRLDEIMGKGVDAYFFDEIQNVMGWEVFVRNLHERGNKVYVTGSNASLLSSELGTRLTGRHISHEIFPFSYPEFLRYFEWTDSAANFMDYLNLGGFPEFLRDRNPEIHQGLMTDIVFRDIAVRHGIRNTHVLLEITLYLLSNLGKEVSLNNLRKMFNVGSPSTVADYVSWLQDTYLLFFLPRFSWSAKSISVNPKKVYCIDTGLAKSNTLSFPKDTGRLLENLVYLNLRMTNKRLFYFREKKECDFVVFSQNKVAFVLQVTDHLNSDNKDREIDGLLAAMDFFNLKQGYVLTMEQSDELKVQGRKIEVCPARQFFNQIRQ
jgi:uncharacterized protein